MIYAFFWHTYICKLFNIWMQEHTVGEIIFTQKLESLPILRMPPIFTAIARRITIPTSQSIPSIILKLIAMHKTQSIQQFLNAVASLDIQGSFSNKIFLLYALGLILIPFRSMKRPKERLISQHRTRYNLIINPNHQPNQCITFSYEFVSSIPQSKQECFFCVWASVEAVLREYEVSYLSSLQENGVGELRYINPIIEGGTHFPSALRFKAGNEMALVSTSEEHVEGIRLRQFLQLARFANSKDMRYQFWSLMQELTGALDNRVRKQHKQDKYYGGIDLENVFVLEDKKITVDFNIYSSQIDKWANSELPDKMRKLISISSNPTQKSFISIDKWSMATILLEIIASRYNIVSFKRQLSKSLEQSSTSTFLSQFFEYLQRERYLIEGPFMKRLKGWVKLEDEDDHVYYQSFLQENEDDNYFNNYSLLEYTEAVNRQDPLEQLIIESVLPPSEAKKVPLPIEDQGYIVANQFDGVNLSIADIRFHLQTLKQTSINYVAQKLTSEEMASLEETIMLDDIFFQWMGFNLRPCSTTKGQCPECDSLFTIYINFCGHGKCGYCYLPLIEIATSDRSSEYAFKIKCDKEKCQMDLSFSLISSVLSMNYEIKHKYCQLLLTAYSNTHSNKYIYCKQKQCNTKSTVIYNNSNSRVLLCPTCKNAVCIDCRQKCHKPLTCEQYRSNKDEISKVVMQRIKDMRWPYAEEAALEDEKRLASVGLEGIKLEDSYLMVWQWLILLACQLRYSHSSSSLGMQSDFLEMLSEKTASTLRDIRRFCRDGAQTSVQCASRCIELQEIHAMRGDILAFAYST